MLRILKSIADARGEATEFDQLYLSLIKGKIPYEYGWTRDQLRFIEVPCPGGRLRFLFTSSCGELLAVEVGEGGTK